MNTSVEDEQPAEPQSGEVDCDAACSCNAQGLSTKVKVTVCLLVALVAVAVVLLGSAHKARTAAKSNTFATATVAGAPAVDPATGTPTATKQQGDVWGSPLRSLASLNEVAVDKDAVFVFVPAKDGKQTEAIKAQVEAAVKKSQARGSAAIAYTLASDTAEYAQVTSKVPAPCVLAMAKGAGVVPVSGEITERKLLEALVTASRPSSCGPSGCGPAGSSTACP